MQYDLSVLIAGRNEMFFAKTVEEVLTNRRGKTEVIAVADGNWPDPPIRDDPDVIMIYHPVSIGQRQSVNEAAKLSRAKFIMKLDAHCMLDEGFDVKLMANCEYDWTVIPTLYNLHAFDWKCNKCGNQTYQGRTPIECEKCDNKTDFERVIIWQPRWHRRSYFYRFDSTLHFQYYGSYKDSRDNMDGLIVGYNLSFDTRSISSSIINLLTDLANSHQLTCSSNFEWFRQNVSSDTMCFPSVNNGESIGAVKVGGIRDKSQVNGITATPIITEVVNNRDILPPATRDTTDKPSVNDTMCECFLSEIGTPSVFPSVNSTNPIPTPRRTINSDVIKKFNDILGGEFVYSEKTKSFHNGSVTLVTVHNKGLAETMSNLGACWFLHRQRYWDMDGLDEEHGSWGQMGTEISCKTWLSGGRQVTNKKTWFSHMFRTQGGDFGFPFPISGRQVEQARKRSREMWFGNKWPKAIHDMDWLIAKFAPVPGWPDTTPTKGIVFYTDNQIPVKIGREVKRRLVKTGLPMVVVSLKPTLSRSLVQQWKNIVLPLKRGNLTMFKEILAGLEASEADIIFFCEHDVLYHPSHFKFVPPQKDKFYYNENVWKLRVSDGHAIHYDCKQTSGLCAYRDLLLKHYRKRVEMVEKNGFTRAMGFEPGTHNRAERVDDYKSESWKSEFPNIDLRHDNNLTESRWSQKQFRSQRNCQNWIESKEIPGWGLTKDILSY